MSYIFFELVYLPYLYWYTLFTANRFTRLGYVLIFFFFFLFTSRYRQWSLFRPHIIIQFFQYIPRGPFGLYYRIYSGVISSVFLSKYFIQFRLRTFILYYTNCILNAFIISSFLQTRSILKSIIFWDVTPCSLLRYLRYLLVLTEFFFRPWRWRRYVPPKRRLHLNRLHGVTS
jgi:hypothetical protein